MKSEKHEAWQLMAACPQAEHLPVEDTLQESALCRLPDPVFVCWTKLFGMVRTGNEVVSSELELTVPARADLVLEWEETEDAEG